MTDEEACYAIEAAACARRRGDKPKTCGCPDGECHEADPMSLSFWLNAAEDMGLTIQALAALAKGKAWVAPVELTRPMDDAMFNAQCERDHEVVTLRTGDMWSAARDASPWGGKHER